MLSVLYYMLMCMLLRQTVVIKLAANTPQHAWNAPKIAHGPFFYCNNVGYTTRVLKCIVVECCSAHNKCAFGLMYSWSQIFFFFFSLLKTHLIFFLLVNHASIMRFLLTSWPADTTGSQMKCLPYVLTTKNCGLSIIFTPLILTTGTNWKFKSP